MKIKKIKLPIKLLLITILVTNCAKTTSSMETLHPEPVLTLISDSITLTPTFTLTPFPERIQISTTTPTIKPIPTKALASSSSPIILSTLPIEDARASLLDLLANNNNCRLPCLWGISPGKSMYQEAKEILLPLSSISDFTVFSNRQGAIDPIYLTDDLMIYTTVRFITYPDTNIVSHLAFDARALREKKGEKGSENVFDSTFLGEKLRLFMLPQILTEYGVPSSVMLFTLAEVPLSNRGPGMNFNILLLYPDQGFLVHYTTEMRVLGKNVVGCPVNAHVELELFPSGNGDNFLELLAPTNWPDTIKNEYKPLEKATSLSLDEFYRTFRQPTDVCLETPANLWPVPER